MKQIAIIVAAIAILSSASTEAEAQRLFGRFFQNRPVTRSYTPAFQNSYVYRPSTNRVPQPVTGYGSNLHRNYVIRREQQRALITGIPPKNRGNILWAR